MKKHSMPVLSEQEREDLIEKCKAAIVSLTPWRGVSEAKSRICFEIALAALTAEPVAFTEKHEISNMHATGLYLRAWPTDRARNEVEGYTVGVYTMPPVPVKQEGEQ